MSNFLFQRPTDPTPVQEREPIAGNCDECSAAELMRYPVLSEGGWYMVVMSLSLQTRCEDCLRDFQSAF
jgi:hypothetical protein